MPPTKKAQFSSHHLQGVPQASSSWAPCDQIVLDQLASLLRMPPTHCLPWSCLSHLPWNFPCLPRAFLVHHDHRQNRIHQCFLRNLHCFLQNLQHFLRNHHYLYLHLQSHQHFLQNHLYCLHCILQCYILLCHYDLWSFHHAHGCCHSDHYNFQILPSFFRCYS